MYYALLRIRRIDERMLAKQRQGKLGFFGTITGQEATPTATAFATEKRDWIFPALRESSIMLCRGFPLSTWLAQAYGNEADLLKGRQMPSHMSGRSVNQVSWSSCIGPQIPQAVGAAWAAKIKGDDVVTIGFMGDGATSQGDFHYAMNFAGVFDVPCVLICQNNHWSISVPTERQTASETIAVKARAYGLPGVRVDGNDVLALYVKIREAVERARSGGGPTFIEAVTYRMGPHSSSDDPSRYRSDEEVAAWAKKDPILRFERYLRRSEVLDDEKKDQMEERLEEEIKAAIDEVEERPPPARGTLMEDVYQELPWHLREQQEELLDGEEAPSGH
jgi:pyruvate dehydrogenase E1 component alpha subunit/2-oxoisovalerate dehydrogenase E1 component alpha subunit